MSIVKFILAYESSKLFSKTNLDLQRARWYIVAEKCKYAAEG